MYCMLYNTIYFTYPRSPIVIMKPPTHRTICIC